MTLTIIEKSDFLIEERKLINVDTGLTEIIRSVIPKPNDFNTSNNTTFNDDHYIDLTMNSPTIIDLQRKTEAMGLEHYSPQATPPGEVLINHVPMSPPRFIHVNNDVNSLYMHAIMTGMDYTPDTTLSDSDFEYYHHEPITYEQRVNLSSSPLQPKQLNFDETEDEHAAEILYSMYYR